MIYSYIKSSNCYNENYEDGDISSAQIEKLIESISFDYTILNDYVLEEYILEGANSKELSKVKKLSEDTGKKIGKTIKEDGLTKESKKTIAKIYDDFLESLKNSIDEIAVSDNLLKKVDSGEYTLENIKRAVALTVACICVNTVTLTALNLILPFVGQLIAIGIVCPFFEEAAKSIAIKGKYAKEFTIVFNATEFAMYVHRGVNPLIRLLPVGMHITTTLVQYFTSNEKIQKKLGLDKEQDKEQLTLIGRIVAFIIHSGWNTILGVLPIIKFVTTISKAVE